MKELEEYLHIHIPISKALGITVCHDSSPKKVILLAPYEKNINHKKTVFGGSLHAVATLAAWSIVHIGLQKERGEFDIVITHSDIDYLSPVTGDFHAECQAPEQEAWEKFITALQRKGKARITLHVSITFKNQPAVVYQGTFAAIRKH